MYVYVKLVLTPLWATLIEVEQATAEGLFWACSESQDPAIVLASCCLSEPTPNHHHSHPSYAQQQLSANRCL